MHPKLPMRYKETTNHYYMELPGFSPASPYDFEGYLMLKKSESKFIS
ncbi:MAG TPA: hypothetical protein PK504_00810 [Ferruginibacter sp.]|nr:hypothetical protein [Ferruginibacter sp.]